MYDTAFTNKVSMNNRNITKSMEENAPSINVCKQL